MGEQKVGKVVQVIGPVVDIKFDSDSLPNIYNKIEIEIGKEFLSMIVYKEENFAQRIFNKIRKLFSRKKEMYE